MPLTDHDKADLRSSLATLIDLDEPEALLGTLRQVAQRQASHNLTPPDIAQRWRHLANALEEAQLTINQTNAPSTHPTTLKEAAVTSQPSSKHEQLLKTEDVLDAAKHNPD